MFSNFLKDHNENFDIFRLATITGILVLICLEIIEVLLFKKIFDAVSFGTCFGTIVGTGGLSVGTKALTEKKQ